MELTLEQRKALALANARVRADGAQSAAPAQEPINWAKELEKQEFDDMGSLEKIYRNMGAGFADIPLAIKQIIASKKPRGMSDLVSGNSEMKQLEREAADKREMDKYMSRGTDMGILPNKLPIIGDTPTLGSFAQFYGKTAPTMAVPAARLGTLPGFASNVATGGALAALDPTVEGESRAMNMLKGAVASSVLPAASALYRVGSNMVTRGGGQRRAADELGKTLAPDGNTQDAVLRQTIERLRTAPQQGAGIGIPLSTAARLRDAEMARLESGSRTRNGANWYDFDQEQAAAVANAFRTATSAADDLGARRGLRSSNYGANRAQAMSSLNDDAFNQGRTQMRDRLDQALTGPDSSNPAVRRMLEAVRDEMDRLGPQFGPEHLATIRANLSGKYNPMDPNVFKAVPRDTPATLGLLGQADDVLNAATNNRWQNAVSGYARDSGSVRAAQAAGQVRSSFYDQATGRVRGVSADAAGDVPKITEAGLNRALDAARGSDKGLLLSDQANTRLEAILSALRAQNIVQGVKRSATAGGGSNTASDQFAAKSAGAVGDAVAGVAGGPAGAVSKSALNSLRAYANANKDRALAEALQNPDQMIALLERKLTSNLPLSASENYLLAMLRGAPAAAATN